MKNINGGDVIVARSGQQQVVSNMTTAAYANAPASLHGSARQLGGSGGNRNNAFLNGGGGDGDVNGNAVVNNANAMHRLSDKFEIPLPFGYHMDLDFLRFCNDELLSGETLDRLKELRKARRRQRKTLEALMGIRQEQRHRELQVREAMLAHAKRVSPPKQTQIHPKVQQLAKVQPPDVVKTPEFIKEALKDAVQDFEKTLEVSREDDLRMLDLLHTSTPKCLAKFNTFPRSLSSPTPENGRPSNGPPAHLPHHLTSTYKMYRPCSNSSLSSISTASSAMLLSGSMPLASAEAVLASLPSSVPPRRMDALETESIASVTSDMSTTTLRNIREQMARSLATLRDYEKQVEAIPVMQVKLSVLKEEKRLLMLKLKQREMQLRRERPDEFIGDEDFFEGYDSDDNAEDDCDDAGERRRQMRRHFEDVATSRARSESPFAKNLTVNPEDFISVRRARSTSCGYNSEPDYRTTRDLKSRHVTYATTVTQQLGRSSTRPNLAEQRSEISVFTSGKQQQQQLQQQQQQQQQQLQQSKAKVATADKSVMAKATAMDRSVSAVEEVVRKVTRDSGTVTDESLLPEREKEVVVLVEAPKPITSERAINTDPAPVARTISHGTNTVSTRTNSRATSTAMAMEDILTREESDALVREAVHKTEQEILNCPLLQKAMTKIEEEAMHGPVKEKVLADAGCQVGDENLRPFVISVGLQCKLDHTGNSVSYICASCQNGDSGLVERRKSLEPSFIGDRVPSRTIGVGECLVIENPPDPIKFREVGVCTEKWVEIIKASKQTDTEDFAFKDTESPRVADLFRPSPERVVLERRSSLRRSTGTPTGSPSVSRRQSALKPTMKTTGTMTPTESKTPTRDARVSASVETRSVGTSAMLLPLAASAEVKLPLPGSPLSTPETESPAVKLSLCDKCCRDIHSVAAGMASPRLEPPSPDMPWLSKIPRPVLENPTVRTLRSATSTDSLASELGRSGSPSGGLMQRSKSSLTPSSTAGRGRLPLYSPRSPLPIRSGLGTPPPHPNTPPISASSPSRRVASPMMARSQSPAPNKSLIPKLSPGPVRKQTALSQQQQQAQLAMSKSTSSAMELPKSLIPRVVTPPALRKMYPKVSDKLAAPDRNVVRKNTFNKITVGLSDPLHEKDVKKEDDAKAMVASSTSSSSGCSSEDEKTTSTVPAEASSTVSSDFRPVPGVALFKPIDEHRTKAQPSKEMRAALKVLNDSFGSISSGANNRSVSNAINIIQQEWFRTSSTKASNPLDVEDYLDAVEDMSKQLLHSVVNLTDVNGNTALHYSVSHGNFDVVSVLLDSKVANPNVLNKAGYTCVMLISLAEISSTTHASVMARLFSMADVNIRAAQHGQTALMLAVSHGRLDMARMLVEAGAGLNVRDEDGSTALMCAAEHGHMEIVKFLLQQPDCDVLAKDNDGMTALAVAMEAGHRDVGVLLYANMSFSRGASPYSSMRLRRPQSTTSLASSAAASPAPTRANKTAEVASSHVGPSAPVRTRRKSSS